MTNSVLLKMAIDIVSCPINNGQRVKIDGLSHDL